MKRYLNIISIIGIISLIVIIYIQLSWLKINIDQQQNYLNQKIIKVLKKVGDKISNKIIKETLHLNNINKSIKSLYNNNLFIENNNLFKIENIISSKELKNEISTELKLEYLNNLEYEFGILNNNEVILSSKLRKKDYLEIFKDNLIYKNFGYPINYKLQGKSLNDIKDIDILYISIKVNKIYIIKKLSFSIALMLCFTFIIIASLYISIRFILKQEQIEIMKNSFIDNMTHEFKTPISTIAIAISSLKNKNIIKNEKSLNLYIDIIKEENNRMLSMVELILKNALLSKGELRIDMVPVNLHEILQKSILKHKLLLIDKQADIQYKLNAKKDIILADEQQLKISISNIIENAIKYSTNKLILNFETYNLENNIFLIIQDNGIGIKEESLKNIFKKFYRENQGNKHNIKGFGLGLNYTKTIIDIHKGKISVISKIGKGTKFTINLPLIN